MMRVTTEIVPGGDENRARTIQTLYIGNASALAEVSDYHVWIDTDPRKQLSPPDLFVTGHRRADGANALLHQITGKLPT